MQLYRVTWTIDVEAETIGGAAVAAFDAMQRPNTTATVFDVAAPSGNFPVDVAKVHDFPLVNCAQCGDVADAMDREAGRALCARHNTEG